MSVSVPAGWHTVNALYAPPRSNSAQKWPETSPPAKIVSNETKFSV
jgi:hypothetical protein